MLTMLKNNGIAVYMDLAGKGTCLQVSLGSHRVWSFQQYQMVGQGVWEAISSAEHSVS